MNIPQVLLDSDGYPTKEWLRFIKLYKPSDEIPIMSFVALLMDGWWAADWGIVLHKKYKGKRKLELHTGGWSGNEDIIDAILANIYLTHFAMRYIKWLTGGHYYFEINL